MKKSILALALLRTEVINERVVLNLNNWLATTTKENAKFIGPMSDGLTPLYNLIDDAQKKAEVKLYIDAYLEAKAVKLTN